MLLKLTFSAYSSHTNLNHSKKLVQKNENLHAGQIRNIVLRQFLIKVSILHNNTGYGKYQFKTWYIAIALQLNKFRPKFYVNHKL